MRKLVLTPRESAIRETDEQVGVLIVLYEEKDLADSVGLDSDFIRERLASLRSLRTHLRRALASHDLLPTAAEPETRELSFLLDRLRGLVTERRFELPLAEEEKLLDLCDRLRELDPALYRLIAPERDDLADAVDALSCENADG